MHVVMVVRLDVNDGRARIGVEPPHTQHIAVTFEQIDHRQSYRVRMGATACGEHARQRQCRIPTRMAGQRAIARCAIQPAQDEQLRVVLDTGQGLGVPPQHHDVGNEVSARAGDIGVCNARPDMADDPQWAANQRRGFVFHRQSPR